jgi:hypothetical protein
MRGSALFLLAAAACGSGVCEGTGGVVDECFEGWTREECEEWDATGVNGSTWTFHASGSCEGYGYPVECGGSWLRSSEDCSTYSSSSSY